MLSIVSAGVPITCCKVVGVTGMAYFTVVYVRFVQKCRGKEIIVLMGALATINKWAALLKEGKRIKLT